MKRMSLIILIIFLSGISLNADEFRPGWPLSIKPELSATFMEYRNNHFHAGIDIKTNRKTGYPIKAPFDGYIDWIHIDETGYGMMMEISDYHGHKARFGHLSSFDGKYRLSKRVLDYRRKNFRRYPVDLWFSRGEYPFKKGDIIAKTGDTGAGPAHLHYELWENSLLINPLDFFKEKFRDKTKPTIKSIIIEPIGEVDMVGGINRKIELPYTADRLKLAVSGKIRVFINCFDRIGKIANKVAVKRISVKIDDSDYLVYRFEKLKKR